MTIRQSANRKQERTDEGNHGTQKTETLPSRREGAGGRLSVVPEADKGQDSDMVEAGGYGIVAGPGREGSNHVRTQPASAPRLLSGPAGQVGRR